MQSIEDLAVRGDFLYTVGGSGLHVFDISVPLTPVLINSLPDQGVSIRLAGSRAFVGHGNAVSIFSLADPHSPSLTTTLPQEAVHGAANMG